MLFTYLMLISLAMFVGISLSADALIHIAAPAYRDAAAYVPVIAGALTAYIAYYGLYRACIFPHRLTWLAIVSVGAAGLYVGLAVWLAGIWGVYGVTSAATIAWLTATGVFYWLDSRGQDHVVIRWRQLVPATLLAIAVVGVQPLLPSQPFVRAAAELILCVVFLGGMVAFGVVSPSRVWALGWIARAAVQRQSAGQLLGRVGSLPTIEREAVVELVGERAPVNVWAARTGVSEDVAASRLVRGLRHLVGRRGGVPSDAMVGRYLLLSSASFDRDDQVTGLVDRGIDLTEVHQLEEVFERLKTISRHQWAKRGWLDAR
jgi:hypothetical protein